MDGLTAVPFIGNDILSKARPDIGVNKPIKITPNFALHPVLKTLNLYGIINKLLYFMQPQFLIPEDHTLRVNI